MTSSTVVLVVVALYLAACLAVGTLPGRKSSESAVGYVAGDRALGLVLMYFITGATIFSAFAFLGMPGWAYERGVAALYILGYGALGFVPFYFLGPRAARLGRRHGFVTQAEMVAHRFQMPALAGVMAAISTLAFVPYLALQMRGAGLVLNVVTRGEIEVWLGAAVVYAVVLAYVWRSGVLGVGWTNVFQGVFMLALAWILGLWLPQRLYGGVGPMFERIAEARPDLLVPPGLASGAERAWTWGEYSSAVIVSIVGFSCWPHLFMKAFSARDSRTLQRTVVLYPTFQIFLLPILLIGFAGILFEPPPASADQILPHILMNLELPGLVVGLFCAGAVAASMSSGDAIAHASASILVRDGWVTSLGRRLGARQERAAIRWVVAAVMVGSYVLAVQFEGTLVNLLLYAYGPIAQLMPVLLATLYWKAATGPGVLAGLLGGSAVTALLSIRPDLRPYLLHEGIYGLAANVVLLVLVSTLTRGRPDTRESDFMVVASRAEPLVPG